MNTGFESKVLWISLFMLITSCSVKHTSVAGIYFFKDKKNPEFSEIIHLKPDSSFNFSFTNSFVSYPVLHGNWKLKNNLVVLNATDVSVIKDGKGGDTLQFKHWTYYISGNSLKRRVYKNHFRSLKKVRTRLKKFMLNNEPF